MKYITNKRIKYFKVFSPHDNYIFDEINIILQKKYGKYINIILKKFNLKRKDFCVNISIIRNKHIKIDKKNYFIFFDNVQFLYYYIDKNKKYRTEIATKFNLLVELDELSYKEFIKHFKNEIEIKNQ